MTLGLLALVVVVGRWRYLLDENACFMTWKYETNTHYNPGI